MAKKTDQTPIIVCQPKLLPKKQWIKAASMAAAINPVNEPARRAAALGRPLKPLELAVMTTKYWGAKGVDLTVSFLDNPPKPLRDRILSHMNAWSQTANVRFRYTARQGQVRIARVRDGYWSYVGTDILSIPLSQQTLNLDSFSMNTPEKEFVRVVRHEAGHTLGFPHEHMRKELVDLIDRQKAIAFFGQTQGWTPQEVEFQVLTPLSQGSLIATDHADPRSIMCYQIPGSITKNGQPIMGGTDIVASDRGFIARIYPSAKKPRKTTASRKRARRARR
jgi:Astacin (Peptidase family M12A)